MHTADCIRHTGPAALSSGCLEHRLAALRTAARLLLVSDYVVSWRFWRYLTSLFLTCLSIYEDGDGRERCWLVVNGYISSAKTRTVFCADLRSLLRFAWRAKELALVPLPSQLRPRLDLRRTAALPAILRRSAARGSAPRKSFGGGGPWCECGASSLGCSVGSGAAGVGPCSRRPVAGRGRFAGPLPPVRGLTIT